MSFDNTAPSIASDLAAIRTQIKVLQYESKASGLETLAFLLELAYAEAVSLAPDQSTLAKTNSTLTLQ